VTKQGKEGVAGWAESRYLGGVIYLAVVPGILGHTSFNALLKYIDPLVIALSLTLEPVFGSIIGWALGFANPPSWLTYFGGLVLLTATLLVTFASHRRQLR
jgi:drug/metabolite transporter (DMT)-like permease